MSAHRLEITLRDDALARLDAARGHEPRASFIKRVLESALDGSSQEPLVPKAPPASTRAPERKPGYEGFPDMSRPPKESEAMKRQRLMNEAKYKR